jgi:hypothetical protein
MQQPTIRYDLLVQDALRGMVRDLLTKVARDGLPGDHHFFISFNTHAPGVQLSSRMKARYPDEIRIVLQHQFWDLIVTDKQFEVGLSFSNIPERLIVPFAALTGFHDPSVPFMLKFEPKEDEAEAVAQEAEVVQAPPPEPTSASAPVTLRTEARPQPARRATDPTPEDETARTDQPAAGASEPAKVVSIDAFRKKT